MYPPNFNSTMNSAQQQPPQQQQQSHYQQQSIYANQAQKKGQQQTPASNAVMRSPQGHQFPQQSHPMMQQQMTNHGMPDANQYGAMRHSAPYMNQVLL